MGGVANADPVPLVPIPLTAAGPQPFVPLPAAPPQPASPLGAGLAGAYGAIVVAPDPAARARASTLYFEAQQRAAAGDAAGALALANLARSAALGRAPVPLAAIPSTIGARRSLVAPGGELRVPEGRQRSRATVRARLRERK